MENKDCGETQKVINELEMDCIGTKSDAGIFIKEHRGVKIAFLAYTYGLDNQDEFSKEDLKYVNVFKKEEVKKDFENSGHENTTEITREGNTLKIVVNEVNDLPWEMPGEFSIETYTDFCMENIRTDIETLDLTVKQPSNKARAVLDMSKTKDQGFGRYFEEDYIIENLK